MEAFRLFSVIFLLILAIVNLSVGASNNAVNSLSSAVGTRTTSFKVIIAIAAMGIFVGMALPNGMMDIVQHGIYRPQHFYFSEIMCILVAVMLTDVVLLDIFNLSDMPASAAVSMVFELVGGTVAIALVKIASSSGALQLGDLLNTEKALTMIPDIFSSVAIAFFFDVIMQYLSRVSFSFNYKRGPEYFTGLFGGLATTSIIYFMLIKGLRISSFMTGEFKDMVYANTGMIVSGCVVFFMILMQVLHRLKANVSRTITLMGTSVLALAFVGNDSVNFIGVPLAGYSPYMDLMAQGGATTTDTFLMTSLLEPAQAPWYFLVRFGIVMIIALATSKKVQNVVKTFLGLSRRLDGGESFGTSPVARVLVWNCSNISTMTSSIMPTPIKNWVDGRFDQSEMIMGDKASFNLVRASANVVLSGLLIALRTSLKLPLSTAYVAFVVVVDASLADRARGRESAVYRITDMLPIIGGQFITVGAVLAVRFIVALLIYWGDTPALIAMIDLMICPLVHSYSTYEVRLWKETSEEEANSTVSKLCKTADVRGALALFRGHSREELQSDLDLATEVFGRAVNGLMNENLRELREVLTAVEERKIHLKQVRRVDTFGVAQLDRNIAVKKGLCYYQGNDFASEVIFSIRRLAKPLKDHIDNNFNSLSPVQKGNFGKVSEQTISFLRNYATMIHKNNYIGFKKLVAGLITLMSQLIILEEGELKRIQGQSDSAKVSMVYSSMVQEAQNVVSSTTNLSKVSRKFQKG